MLELFVNGELFIVAAFYKPLHIYILRFISARQHWRKSAMVMNSLIGSLFYGKPIHI